MSKAKRRLEVEGTDLTVERISGNSIRVLEGSDILAEGGTYSLYQKDTSNFTPIIVTVEKIVNSKDYVLKWHPHKQKTPAR